MSNAKSKYSSNMIGLLLVNLCFGVTAIFINTFLLAQIFVMTGESFIALGRFSLLNFSFVFIFHVIGGMLCKRFNPIWVTRFSAVLACLLLILIMLLHEQLIYYYVVFGLLWGCVVGLYFCAYQFLVSKKSEGESTLSYISLYVSIASIVRLIFPVTFGAIIHYGDFIITSSIILFIGILQILATLLIKHDPEKSRKLNIRGYFKAIKEAKHLKQGIQLWFVISLTGFADTIIIITTALVMITFGTSLSLGILTSVSYVFVMIISRLYKKAGSLRKYFYGVAVALPLLGVSLLLWSVSLFSVALFMGFYLSTRNIIFMEEETTRLNAAKYWNGSDFIMESNLFYEAALAFGAIVSAVLVIVIGTFYIQWLVISLLAAVVFAFALHGVLLKRWQYINARNQI